MRCAYCHGDADFDLCVCDGMHNECVDLHGKCLVCGVEKEYPLPQGQEFIPFVLGRLVLDYWSEVYDSPRLGRRFDAAAPEAFVLMSILVSAILLTLCLLL